MILIADSGSTKTDWRFISSGGKIIQYESAGLNPYFWTDAKLLEEISCMAEFFGSNSVREIYFYGSGLGDPHQKTRMTNALEGHFCKLNRLEVQHDLLGAARAACGHEAGIACILGTGANACFFDGSQIKGEAVSLGYILGDEGSGAWFGKQFLAAYLRKELPAEIDFEFTRNEVLQREEVLMQVYRGEQPNKYLAQFTRFLEQHKNNPYIYCMIYDGINSFLDKHVSPFRAEKHISIHFVGSLAFHFQDIVRKAVLDSELRCGRFLQSPIAGLTLYHQEQ
jgi:glucosamine kinase